MSQFCLQVDIRDDTLSTPPLSLFPNAVHPFLPCTPHLRAKQHIRPVLPKNHRKPMNRTIDSAAVAYNKNLKKLAVRTDADF